MKRLSATRRRLFALGLVAGAAIVAASVYGYSALAGPTPQSYTGCLKAGQLMNIVIDGTGQTATCPKPGVLINWSQAGPTGQDGATGATGSTGANGATGATGPSGGATNALFANVAPDGTLVAGSPGTTATMDQVGLYEVTFTRDVDNCGVVGSVGDNTTGGSTGIDPSIQVNLFTKTTSLNTVRVATTDDGTTQGLSFHLIAVC